MIVPGLTESYGSKHDPEEEDDIPFCTLKMFPEEAVHCVEWARDRFGKFFEQQPAALQATEPKPRPPRPAFFAHCPTAAAVWAACSSRTDDAHAQKR